mmetsp:Transcript_28030/g.96923  ORF Transcript_28030/g.96923 Transcript_28030/m.96923 type:complete len:314 (+) Transcript_28030:1453-2394(+)
MALKLPCTSKRWTPTASAAADTHMTAITSRVAPGHVQLRMPCTSPTRPPITPRIGPMTSSSSSSRLAMPLPSALAKSRSMGGRSRSRSGKAMLIDALTRKRSAPNWSRTVAVLPIARPTSHATSDAATPARRRHAGTRPLLFSAESKPMVAPLSLTAEAADGAAAASCPAGREPTTISGFEVVTVVALPSPGPDVVVLAGDTPPGARNDPESATTRPPAFATAPDPAAGPDPERLRAEDSRRAPGPDPARLLSPSPRRPPASRGLRLLLPLPAVGVAVPDPGVSGVNTMLPGASKLVMLITSAAVTSRPVWSS